VTPELRAALRMLAWNMLEGRRARQLTVEDAAWKASIASRYWSKIEAGDANPTLATLVKVACGLGVAIGDLFAPVRR
jgi:transcriptional regulator with XRE-family HTH domain